MKVLVAYESKYGATQEIAERIGERLRRRDIAVDVMRARDVHELAGYDAFVIGSAVYYGSWLKDATQLVLRQHATLATRPLWLFSSGPVSTSVVDAQGRDLRAASEPKTVVELRTVVVPRDHRVFFGALEPTKMGIADRMIASLPAFPGARGDFRDWNEIEAWADQIGSELATSIAVSRVEPARALV